MNPDDGLDEDEPLFPWLPPDDRLWRHPSELAASRGPAGTPGDTAERRPGAAAGGGATGPGGPSTALRSSTATLLSPRDIDRRLWAVALLAGVVGALLASGAGVVAGQYHHTLTVVRPIEQVVQANPYVTIATNPRSDDIVDIAARMRPNIVELLVSTNGAAGSGSGVFFTGDGYILTNDHVVGGAQSVVAVLSDGRHINCHLVGSDRATDIAVVKLDTGKPQSVAILGSSAEVKVGQLAIAIGSPLGMAGGASVTSGIISAVDRQVAPRTGPPLLDMIQTDAAIESGSSGGALVDASGMVIGITTAIPVPDQGSSFGLATPIEVARDVANQILSTGKVTHAWLGVEGSDVDVASARSLGIVGGAVVQSVEARSPAARAGVAPTDVVTAFAGQPVDSMSTLEISIREHRPGDTVPISFIHNGTTHTEEVVLLERPDTDVP